MDQPHDDSYLDDWSEPDEYDFDRFLEKEEHDEFLELFGYCPCAKCEFCTP